MNKLFSLIIAIFVSGCISDKGPKMNFSSGRYTFELNGEHLENKTFKMDMLFEVKDNHVDIISPLNGDLFLYGVIYDNKLLISQFRNESGTTATSYQGDLTSDNNIEGLFKGRHFSKPGPANSYRKSETQTWSGKFKIYPSVASTTPRDSLNFLPTVKYGDEAIRINPLTFRIVVDKNGDAYIPNKACNPDVEADFISSGLTKVTPNQLTQEIKKSIREWGNSIPLEFYIDRNVKYSTLVDIFIACCHAPLGGNYKMMLLPPKWESPVSIPFILPPMLRDSEYDDLSYKLNFVDGKYALLINDKVDGKYNFTELDNRLQKILNIGVMLLAPSLETQTVELVKVMELLYKRNTQICLE